MRGNYSKLLLFYVIVGTVLFAVIYYCIIQIGDSLNYDKSDNIASLEKEAINERSDDKKDEISAQKRGINIIAVGDMMLGRKVGKLMNDGMNPFEFINLGDQSVFGKADIIIGNLEGPITNVSKCQDKPYSFKFATNTAEFLKSNSFTHLNLANNHSYDCFSKGLGDTKKYLDDAGLIHFGGMNLEDSFYFDEINGSSVAFIGIDLTIEPVKMNRIMSLLPEIRKSVDYIVVSIHWGDEYRKEANKNQIALAHNLVDSGVDLIIGHHPHVTEQIEVYKGKIIAYSLGNFIFDQIGEEQNKSFVLSVEINGNTQFYKTYPIVIKGSQPRLTN